MTKKITSLRVVRAGSSPDVDSDINTERRPETIQHVKEIYGNDNVASIGTFSTLAAKGAFKTMCTIYEIPYAQANKITELIPSGGEGGDITLSDMYDPAKDAYEAAADFRSATAGAEWEQIIEGAMGLEGKNKTTGVHPCGIVISSKQLLNTIPLQVRQDDGLVVTQWSYPELESLGLIKMDFLGLDTVDLIQHTVENIMKNGKTPPNMLEIIHGPMDDKKTFEVLARGETIGLFQLASPGVQDLLKRIKPTAIDDIIATTALYRPGPMGVQSHIRYADRKNGKEEIDFIHSDFKGTAIEDILGNTYGLVVYQEQIIRIANQIAGMTLQEGDDLRSAMGKKKMAKMLSMKPKFIEGGQIKGYSAEAMEVLWSTCEEFAKYGFNLAHSVAYGINAYQTAFLKTHYPVEFMAALISQNVGNREKVLIFLQEARRMGLKVGSIDVNTSAIKVSPDYSGKSSFDIVFGFSGASGVSRDVAKIIIDEREKNGLFKSVQDMVNRCYPLGITNRKIYENIAKAGGFDQFGVSRRAVVENLTGLLAGSKTKESKGASLFDMFGETQAIDAGTVDLTTMPEYPHVEMLKHEASVIGLYLTSHPLTKAGPGLSKARTATVASLMKSPVQTTATLTVAITDVSKKIMRRGGKRITVTMDDGTGYMSANISRDIVKGIDKKIAQERLRKLYEDGEAVVPDEMEELILDGNVTALEDIEQNSVYVVKVSFRPSRGESPYGAAIHSITPLALADDGSLPIRMRLLYTEDSEQKARDLAKKLPIALSKRNPGDFPIFVSIARKDSPIEAEDDLLYKAAIEEIRGVAVTKDVAKSAGSSDLWGNANAQKKSKKPAAKVKSRDWAKLAASATKSTRRGFRPGATIDDWDFIEKLTYVDSGYRAAKSKKTELDIERYLGVESYDFGTFDPSILED